MARRKIKGMDQKRWMTAIAEACAKKNMSMNELGVCAGLNKHYFYTSLDRESDPALDAIKFICKATGIRADWLLGLSDKKYNIAPSSKWMRDITGCFYCKACGGLAKSNLRVKYCTECGAEMEPWEVR